MFNSGKCPKCENVIRKFLLEEVDGDSGPGARTTWRCLTYLCPTCRTIVGVQIDPIAIKADLLKEIKR